MEIMAVFERLGIALGLGLLVGLQRERVNTRIGGLRTFPLVTVFGTVCGLLAMTLGGWVVAGGIAATAAIVILANAMKPEGADIGMTTEVSVLLMFGVGAYLAQGYIPVAVALGGGTAVLLQFKSEIHGIADRLSDREVTAIMRFALISLVILPVLPNQTYGPYDVLNPRGIWLLVVLIVGISLAGYIAYKFFGEQAGMVLGGVLGGLISSTATTVSYSKRTAGQPGTGLAAGVVVVIASTIVYPRVLVEIGAVSPGLLPLALMPLLAQMAVLAVIAGIMWYASTRDSGEMPQQENPTELKAAFIFAGIYAVVLFVVAAVRDYFGAKGLYVVAAISGLTDVDAITLSTAHLVSAAQLAPDDAWRIITVAVISNLVFKAGVVAVLGSRKLLIWVATAFGITIAASLAIVFLWPKDAVALPF